MTTARKDAFDLPMGEIAVPPSGGCGSARMVPAIIGGMLPAVVVGRARTWEMSMFQEFRNRLQDGRLICPFCGESSLALSASDGELDPPLPEAAHGPGGMLLVHTSSERGAPTPIPDPHADRRVEVYCENHYCEARDFVIADTALAKPWPSAP